MNRNDPSTPALARLGLSVARLLEIEENARTRGHHALQRFALIKAIQGATTLRNEALDRAGTFNHTIRKNTEERLW